MNVLVPLFVGFAVGYAFRSVKTSSERLGTILEVATGLSVLTLIFLMGVETGEIGINAGWMLLSSIIFAVLMALGSLAFALFIWRGKR